MQNTLNILVYSQETHASTCDPDGGSLVHNGKFFLHPFHSSSVSQN